MRPNAEVIKVLIVTLLVVTRDMTWTCKFALIIFYRGTALLRLMEDELFVKRPEYENHFHERTMCSLTISSFWISVMNCSNSSHGSQIIFHILWTIKIPSGRKWKVRFSGGKSKWSGCGISVIDQLQFRFSPFPLIIIDQSVNVWSGMEWR